MLCGANAWEWALTDGSDDGGCKNHCIGPVPVVEGLVPCDGHALICSIRYHLNRETVKIRGGQASR